MAQVEALETDERSRLLDAARDMVLRGEQKFSISQLCAVADVPRDVFRTHFSGKTQVMAILMAERQSPAEPASFPAATLTPAPMDAVADAPVEAKPVEAAARPAPEPSGPAPDAWLERRLRVFERALTSLEAKAETREREQARIIAELEEKLARLQPQTQTQTAEGQAFSVAVNGSEPEPQRPAKPMTRAAQVAPLEDILAPSTVARAMQSESEQNEQDPSEDLADDTELEDKPSARVLQPLSLATISRQDLAEVVQLARGRARAAAATESERPQPSGTRARLLAVGGLALLALFLFVGLSLGKSVLATDANAATHSDGVAYRHMAAGALERTIALADAGDAKAQVRLALIYLKGQGVAADPAAALRWSRAAADSGQPIAQYLMGSFYREGGSLTGGVLDADAARAFHWFEAAARKGNLKAMHNLAIAYAEGLGTDRDEKQAADWFAKAAERGYVDSAFDLAVLYERGIGVGQDLKQALTWYGIAARMGDAPAEERVQALGGQISHQAAAMAATAAQNFTPVPPLTEANQL
jgi:TPR repeat protein